MRPTLLAPLVLAICLGCDDAPSRPRSNSAVSGTWMLETVNGQSLPFIGVSRSACRFTLDSSRIWLPALCEQNRCGRWEDFVKEGPPPGTCGQLSLTDRHEIVYAPSASGDLTIDRLFPTFRRSYGATVAGNTMTITIRDAPRLPDGEYVYRRRP